MNPRPALPVRSLAAAAMCAATLAVTACSGGGSGAAAASPAPSGPRISSGAVSPARVLSLTASQAAGVPSL